MLLNGWRLLFWLSCGRIPAPGKKRSIGLRRVGGRSKSGSNAHSKALVLVVGKVLAQLLLNPLDDLWLKHPEQ